jgi:hypothetical protein
VLGTDAQFPGKSAFARKGYIRPCDGVERPPKPSEASSETDPRIVTAVCEGKVRECRPLLLGRGHILD